MRRKVFTELEANLGPAWTSPPKQRHPPPPGALREPPSEDEQEDSASVNSREWPESEEEQSISDHNQSPDSGSDIDIDSEEEGSTIVVDLSPTKIEEDLSSSYNLKMGPIVAKRKATEEPNTPSDSKRIKSSHDGSIEPDEKNAIVVKRIPFPEKVSQHRV
jgi:hypothetical protein